MDEVASGFPDPEEKSLFRSRAKAVRVCPPSKTVISWPRTRERRW